MKKTLTSLTDVFKGLLKAEDWLAVWTGFLLIILVLVGFRPEVPKFNWATDNEFATAVSQAKPKLENLAREAKTKGESELANSLEAFKSSLEAGNRKDINLAAKDVGTAAKKSQDKDLQKKSSQLATQVGGKADALIGKVLEAANTWNAVKLGVIFLIFSTIGIVLMGGKVGRYLLAFPFIYLLAWLSQFIAGNATMNYWGLEYVIFALILGLFISNVIGTPGWLLEAIKTEYYIKTGLVILGAGILFGEILQAGALGIIQAILVVSVVWYFCFWLSRKLKIDDEFAAMLSTAVSICGVSAAIAACGAIQGDRKKLSYVTSIVLIVAAPMMIIMPWVIRNFGIPDIVGGAWLGGTLDTTGSVVAAGSLVSEQAMRVGVIVKFSQNVLIGVAAFFLAIWWTLKNKAETGGRPSAKVIWERFPKFVLGFFLASFVFSFFLSPETVKATKGVLNGLRTVWFALAFTSIGLETRFTEFLKMGKGRPAVAFIGAQAFNVIWTLILAYLIFGGVVFAIPAIK